MNKLHTIVGSNNYYQWNSLYSIIKNWSLDNAILELWLAEPSWYMRHYNMFSKYGNCMHLLKIENKLNWLFLQIKSERILDILWAFLIKQIFHSHLMDKRWL